MEGVRRGKKDDDFDDDDAMREARRARPVGWPVRMTGNPGMGREMEVGVEKDGGGSPTIEREDGRRSGKERARAI